MKKNLFADRIGGINFGSGSDTYKFSALKKLKETLPLDKLIDLGVGEPEYVADKIICDELIQNCVQKENRFYADNGIKEFLSAGRNYLEKVYGIKTTAMELLHGIGTKNILALLPKAFINPGDWCITTVPGYPILGTNTQYLGGKVWPLKLEEKNSFYPDYESIPTEVLQRAKLFYINYPNNPTGQTGSKDFFHKLLTFCAKHQIILINDNAYGTILRAGSPLSLFNDPLALKWGIETHSLSKAFNMTGWRLGFIVGNEKWIKAFGCIKENSDSGQFIPIQKAGIKALEHPELTAHYNKKYFRRMDRMEMILKKIGFSFSPSKGTFYIYTTAPTRGKNERFANATEAALFIMKNAHIITVPWEEAGDRLRFSMTFESPENDDEKVFREIEKRLLQLELKF